MRTFSYNVKVGKVFHSTAFKAPTIEDAFEYAVVQHPDATVIRVEEWDTTHPDGDCMAILEVVEVRNG